MNIKLSFTILIILFSFILIPKLFAQEFTFAAMSDSRGNDGGSNEIVLSTLVNHLVANQKEVKLLMFMGDNKYKMFEYDESGSLINSKEIPAPPNTVGKKRKY